MKKKLSILIVIILIISAFPSIIDVNNAKVQPVKSVEDFVIAYDENRNLIKLEDVKAEYKGLIVSKKNGEILLVESLDDVENIAALSDIKYIEPNYIGHVSKYSTSDTYYDKNSWAYEEMRIEPVWREGFFGKMDEDVPIVAVIDSGVVGTGSNASQKHEDLNYNNIIEGVNTVSNGYYCSTDTNDDLGHGTFVTGVIAASINNGVGIAGAMSDVKICPIKCVDYEGQSTQYDEIKAIEKAVELGADVINLSLGYGTYSKSEEDACLKAAADGVIISAAAGNDGSAYDYPASNEGVISVASININNQCSYFSQHNDKVDVTAPGENLYGLNKEGGYETNSGTSFSSPQVAALAAMCKGIDPSINYDKFMELLGQTCIDLGSEGRDEYYGYGCINFEETYNLLMENVDTGLSSATVIGCEDKDYTGSKLTQSGIQVSMSDDGILTEGVDYRISYVNNIYPGKATMIIEASAGGKYHGKKLETFYIRGSLSEAGVTASTISFDRGSYYYTGAPIIPTLTVIDRLGRELQNDTDYILSCDSNVEIGTANVEVIGVGIYTGVVKAQFSIVQNKSGSGGGFSPVEEITQETTADVEPIQPIEPITPVIKAPTIKNIVAGKRAFTLKWKQNPQVDGYKIQYSSTLKFTRGKKTKNKLIKKSKITSIKIKKLKAKKAYYVRMKTYILNDGKRVYSKWSRVKKITTRK